MTTSYTRLPKEYSGPSLADNMLGMFLAWALIIWVCLTVGLPAAAITHEEWRAVAILGWLAVQLFVAWQVTPILEPCQCPCCCGGASIWWDLSGWIKNKRAGRKIYGRSFGA